MTTPFFPTKTILKSTTYSPAQLIADDEFEGYLLSLTNNNNEGIQFIRAMMAAYRSGDEFVEFTFGSAIAANTVHDYLTNGPTPYGYTLTVLSSTIKIDWS